MFKGKAEVLLELLQQPSITGPPPTSAIRDAREAKGWTQKQLALKADMSQSRLADLESGKAELHGETSHKIAEALGVNQEELEFAENLSALHRAAIKGSLDPRLLLETILDFARSTPDSEVAENLTDAMLQILRKALETYREEGMAPPESESPVSIKSALKSGITRPDRDVFGRRRSKPYGKQ